MLLLATESLPNPTRQLQLQGTSPAARDRGPSLAFDFGQCATLASVVRNISISLSPTRYAVGEQRTGLQDAHVALDIGPLRAPEPSTRSRVAPDLQQTPQPSQQELFSFRLSGVHHHGNFPLKRDPSSPVVITPCAARVVKHRRARARSRSSRSSSTLVLSFSKFSWRGEGLVKTTPCKQHHPARHPAAPPCSSPSRWHQTRIRRKQGDYQYQPHVAETRMSSGVSNSSRAIVSFRNQAKKSGSSFSR